MKSPSGSQINNVNKVLLPPKLPITSRDSATRSTFKPERKKRISKRNSKNVCCSNCKCEKSPLWRKGEGKKVLCNKCGKN